MMASHFLNRSKANALATRIRDAERQVVNRQRRINIRTDTLVRNIEQQMTAPTTLLLVSGAGFIIGELTKCQPVKSRGTSDKIVNAETSPLRIAFNLITSIQTLYTALPMVWIVKTFFQPDTSSQSHENQFQPTTPASGATNK
ncbi:hypothetical protein MGMO_16c00080 [Methyloglobulus morosus KoM1]|uniref:Uncharacterized protein n=1 Tax=Methyloglobulus morosus KoM1 TaxID=1116472 RepID=V5C0I0_9GAMM|nr:hypothetical protein [Methyloglobulus morosus]ESS73574.1 hypothetical protein MGMO_16c00080 [Methyloglobulus morosus KoM1]